MLINGIAARGIDPLDRGLQYGDGVFRTLKVVSGQVRWWRDHYAKLVDDCLALGLRCPAEDVLKAEVGQMVSLPGIGSVKIIITRGTGPRGYKVSPQAEPTRMVMAFRDSNIGTEAAQVRWCGLRLSRQPRLARIKHLNRLENILARSEWDDADIAEGLLQDDSGHVICGTMTNLFIVEHGTLITPDLSQCGVAGVTRGRLLRAASRHGLAWQIATLSPERVLAAEQVLLCNSLVEIWRVEKLGAKYWPDNGWAHKLRNWLNEDD